MKARRCTIIVCHLAAILAVAMIFTAVSPCNAAPRRATRIFAVFSYHPGNLWSQSVLDGIQKTIADKGADITVEADYLDAMRFPDKATLQKVSDLVEEKMRLVAPDLVIACDNTAFDFVLERRQRSFPSAPVVFCGINGFQPSMISGQGRVTGVGEDISVEATIHIALALHPGTRRIVVINRTDSVVSRGNRVAVERALPTISGDVAVERWDDLPAGLLRDRLKALRRGTIVFINALAVDESGKHLSFGGTGDFIRSYSSVPAYSFWDIFLDHGIVGGKMTSGPKQGEIAGGLALRILAGENPDDIPVISSQEANRFVFDMREVRRFAVPRSTLPAGSLLLNDPISPLFTYRWYFAGAVLFLLGESLVIFILVMNIRLRRKTQSKLELEQAQLGLVLDAAKMGMWTMVLPSGQVRTDEHMCAMLGYSPGEMDMVDTNQAPLIHPDDRQRVYDSIHSHLRPGDPPFESEHRMLSKSGAWVWVWQRGVVVTRDHEGNPLLIYATILDITERKRAEEQRLDLERRLLHSQKLESLGVLAGGIAHDFNNLLTAILGNLELAQTDLPAFPNARTCMEAAVAATHKAADLTRQMLAYSGKGRFIVKPLDVSSLVDEIASLLRTSIARTASLTISLSRDLPPIMADPVQVQQVIMNLITNASEAIGDRAGAITISTGIQDCDEAYLSGSRLEKKPLPGRFVWIEVTDNGCGMSADVQSRLFDPFFTSKATGRGLGMSAVLGIVGGHDGAISVYSEVGIGTKIKVLFPALRETAVQEKKAAPAERSAEAQPLSGLALVVDDEESVRLLAQRMLEHMGLRVTGVADSEEALELFRAKPQEYSFVLLDLTMPKMDGAVMFVEMKRIRPDVKIILSSGYDQQEVTQRFAGKGLAGFVQKPYTLAALREEVRRVLNGEGGESGGAGR